MQEEDHVHCHGGTFQGRLVCQYRTSVITGSPCINIRLYEQA